jgi:hypothetical protein
MRRTLQWLAVLEDVCGLAGRIANGMMGFLTDVSCFRPRLDGFAILINQKNIDDWRRTPASAFGACALPKWGAHGPPSGSPSS